MTHPRDHVQKASDVLLEALRDTEDSTITVGRLTRAIGDRAFGLILLLFALPNCVPAPPGLGSIMGLPLALFGIQLALGRRIPWLPGFLARRRFQRDVLLRLVERGLPYIRKIERVCRPRMTFITGPKGERIFGIIITILASAILIPLPLTNFIPALGIGIIALGLLEEDGVTALIGVLVGTTGLAIVAAVLIGTFELVFG